MLIHLIMESQEDRVLRYIQEHPYDTLQLEDVAELDLSRAEANGVLFNLLQDEFIIEAEGRLQITSSGVAYLARPE